MANGKHIVVGVHGGMAQWVRGNAPDVRVHVIDFDAHNDMGEPLGIYEEGQLPLDEMPHDLSDCEDDEGLQEFFKELGLE
jgi:hypothetical protein